MESGEFESRLRWLEEERRKDKDVITSLSKRIETLESVVSTVGSQVEDLSTRINQFKGLGGRFDLIEASLATLRGDLTKQIDALAAIFPAHEDSETKKRREDQEAFSKALTELRSSLDVIPDIQHALQVRAEETVRLAKSMDDTRRLVYEKIHGDEDMTHRQKLLEDQLAQQIKRGNEAQSTLAVLQKRVEEMSGRVELFNEGLKRQDVRANELVSSESERRKAQVDFIEKQALVQVDRDRTWRDWEARIADIDKLAGKVTSQLQEMTGIGTDLSREREAMQQVSERFERRINEISEMQRLAEDKLREQWEEFKGSDQKRWALLNMGSEEKWGETAKQIDKLEKRLVSLEAIAPELEDALEEMREETGRRLQSLIVLTHDWMEASERVSSDRGLEAAG
jgi:chromosome segregation ATPase